MDSAYEATIVREFGKFVEKGRVYKGLKPVLWCTVDQTALAEAEVEYEDHLSPSVYVKFPLTASPGGDGIGSTIGPAKGERVEGRGRPSFGTTTPWTLPANQAVCLHPEFDYAVLQAGDEAFIVAVGLEDGFAKACKLEKIEVLGKKKGKDFEGWTCHPPFSKKEVPILNGNFVTLEQGTGCVHIAPGHGMDDYLLVLKYNKPPHVDLLPNSKQLEILVPVNNAGRFTEEFPECAGQPVLEANPGIVDLLRAKNLLVGEKKTGTFVPPLLAVQATSHLSGDASMVCVHGES